MSDLWFLLLLYVAYQYAGISGTLHGASVKAWSLPARGIVVGLKVVENLRRAYWHCAELLQSNRCSSTKMTVRRFNWVESEIFHFSARSNNHKSWFFRLLFLLFGRVVCSYVYRWASRTRSWSCCLAAITTFSPRFKTECHSVQHRYAQQLN